MGTTQSTDLDKERILEIATEVNGQFAKEFQVWYKDAINHQIRAASKEIDQYQFFRPADYMRRQLLAAPTSTKPIKAGFIYKLGFNVRNWKYRYFVAFNQQDNFVIKYYDDETMQREKGKINCFGYIVKVFTPEEDRIYGHFGIKLIHHEDVNKRIWILRCDNAQQQSQWIQVFMNSCKKTVFDHSISPLIHQAFCKALQCTKATYGYFGTLPVIQNTEVEALCQLTKQILHREVLDEYIIHHKKKIQQQHAQQHHHSHHGGSLSGGSSTMHASTGSNGRSTSMLSSATSSSSSAAAANPQILAFLQHMKVTIHSWVYPIVLNTWKHIMEQVQTAPLLTYSDVVTASLPALLLGEDRIMSMLSKKYLHQLITPIHEELVDMVYIPWLRSSFGYYIQSYGMLLKQFYRVIKFCLLEDEDVWDMSCTNAYSITSPENTIGDTPSFFAGTLPDGSSPSFVASRMTTSAGPHTVNTSNHNNNKHPAVGTLTSDMKYMKQKQFLIHILAEILSHIDDLYYPSSSTSASVTNTTSKISTGSSSSTMTTITTTTNIILPAPNTNNILPPIYDIFWQYYSQELVGTQLMTVLEYAYTNCSTMSVNTPSTSIGVGNSEFRPTTTVFPYLTPLTLQSTGGGGGGDATRKSTASTGMDGGGEGRENSGKSGGFPSSATAVGATGNAMHASSYQIYSQSIEDVKVALLNILYTFQLLLANPSLVPAKAFSSMKKQSPPMTTIPFAQHTHTTTESPSTTSSTTESVEHGSSIANSNPIIDIFFYLFQHYIYHDIPRIILNRLMQTFHNLILPHLQERIYPNGMDIMNSSLPGHLEQANIPKFMMQYPCINEELIHFLLNQQMEESIVKKFHLMEEIQKHVSDIIEWIQHDLEQEEK